MKKVLAIVLVFIVLISIAGCRTETPPALSSDPTTEPTTEPMTEPTTTPTTEPKETEPEVELDWYIENLQYLSYEEYFATDHPFNTTNPPYIRQGDMLYLMQIERAQNNQALRVKIGKTNHLVPGSETLADYSCFGTDRHYAYLHSDTDVVRVDLLTGEQETILTYERLLDIRLLGDVVLRYCIQEGDSCNIYQMYLPTGDTKLLYGGLPGETPLCWFSLIGPYSTQETVSWRMINPDMAAILRKELAKPDSIYITFGGKDLSVEWSTMTLDFDEDYDYDTRIPILMHSIQEHTGIPAWAKFTYNPADGTCEKTTGIVDTCWFGSGYGHDHYDPHKYDVTPTWNVSDPVPISNISLPENPEKMYERDIYEYINSNCQYGYGCVYRLKSQDVLQVLFDIDLTEVMFSDDYVYGITPDNTVVQASYDGTVRNTIYTGNGTLSELLYGCGKLYFLDDGNLMEIDIPAKTYRSLMDVPYLTWMMMDAPDVLYLEVVRGLTADGFVADVSKLTLEEVGYRL